MLHLTHPKHITPICIVLHYAPDVAGLIVNVCVILHNICKSANISVPQLSNEDMEHDGTEQPRCNNLALQIGHITRSSLRCAVKLTLFSSRIFETLFGRARRVSERQLDILWEFLMHNKDIA
uniref:SFRICE_023705 n=1 Tax=Spodoptera frugiperda TaxID=7108 RepID=A0A2H1WEW7_SPOFR